MKRILHIIPTLDRSGAEKQLVLLTAGLPRSEFDVHVCALTHGGPLAAELAAAQIPITVLNKRWKADPATFWRLVQHIKTLKPDLVQTWLFAANSYGRAAARLARVPRIVGGERCVDPWKQPHELAIDRWLARISDRIIVNSSGVSDFYIRRRLPADKFVLIPNGIGPAAPSPYSRTELLQQLGLPLAARLLGAVGRLWPQKRLDDLIWATDLLKVIRDDVYLLVIGDGPERERLERFTRQVEILDKVRFLGARHDVPQLLPHFDVLCLASEYEGLPNVIMEAMAAGVPVVASDISGNRDLVAHGETGLLTPVGDRAGYARQALKILDDADLSRRLGAAGQARIERDFTIEQMVRRHVDLYRELLS